MVFGKPKTVYVEFPRERVPCAKDVGLMCYAPKGPPYFKKPLMICSSASFSESPRVISLISCSPAILPIAAS